ncbi:hypothetical protein NDU88_010030, partial [Pleurodeles waltl]
MDLTGVTPSQGSMRREQKIQWREMNCGLSILWVVPKRYDPGLVRSLYTGA